MSIARLTCALSLNLLKSMTHDLDLKASQGGGGGAVMVQHKISDQ